MRSPMQNDRRRRALACSADCKRTSRVSSQTLMFKSELTQSGSATPIIILKTHRLVMGVYDVISMATLSTACKNPSECLDQPQKELAVDHDENMASRSKRVALVRHDDPSSPISANRAGPYGWYPEGLPHPIHETSDNEHTEKGGPTSFEHRRVKFVAIKVIITVMLFD